MHLLDLLLPERKEKNLGILLEWTAGVIVDVLIDHKDVVRAIHFIPLGIGGDDFLSLLGMTALWMGNPEGLEVADTSVVDGIPFCIVHGILGFLTVDRLGNILDEFGQRIFIEEINH